MKFISAKETADGTVAAVGDDGLVYFVPPAHDGEFRALLDAITVEPYIEPGLGENDYKTAIVGMMDETAQSRRYDSALSLSTYVGSTNAAWSAEALAFVAWRDAVWAYCYEQLALVAIQRRSQPTVAEFLAELPPMVWPAP